VQYLYPDGSVLYWGYRPSPGLVEYFESRMPGHQKKCTDMDGINTFNALLRGPDKDRKGTCKIEFCTLDQTLPLSLFYFIACARVLTRLLRFQHEPGQHDDEPVTALTTGNRHVTHHMMFQRDVMADFHKTVIGNWGGASLWDAVQRCWNSKQNVPYYCTGRFTEYEYCEEADTVLPNPTRISPHAFSFMPCHAF